MKEAFSALSVAVVVEDDVFFMFVSVLTGQ